MRSQRVKRIKRSKKSKMSKRIQRTKKTKRTKRKKRTQINHRKNRKKTLKGGAYSWEKPEIVKKFGIGRKTSETIEQRKERIRTIFDEELDKLSMDTLTSRELPLLPEGFVTHLAEKYELTEDLVNKIFEEEKIKKIQEWEVMKEKIREIFNNFISRLNPKYKPYALEEDFLNLTSWNQLATPLSEELFEIGIIEGGKYSLQFVGAIFEEEKIKKLQEMEEVRLRDAKILNVPDRDTSPERRGRDKSRKVSFSSQFEELSMPDGSVSTGTLPNKTKKSKRKGADAPPPVDDHYGVYEHLRRMNLLHVSSYKYALKLIKAGHDTPGKVDTLTLEYLSSLGFKGGHIKAIERYRESPNSGA